MIARRNAQPRVSPEPSRAPALDAPLVVEGIHKSFGENHVLKGIDLQLQHGELLTLLGGNGCGKSTLLRCAIRLLEADAGSARLCGHDLAALKGRHLRLARREAAVIFQQIALVKRRTAIDNVCCGALGRIPLSRSLSPASFPRQVRDRGDRAPAGRAARTGVAGGGHAVRRPGAAGRDRPRLLPAGVGDPRR
jgi:phosphonate transport system ATP-binding protein